VQEEQAAERARRKAVEAELETRQRRERARRMEEEGQAWEREMERRTAAIGRVRAGLEVDGFVDLDKCGEAETEGAWVEKLVRAEGLIGGDVMITGNGYAVRVTNDQVQETYRRVASAEKRKGKDEIVQWEELAEVLEDVVRNGIGHELSSSDHKNDETREQDEPEMREQYRIRLADLVPPT
jgi:hypothetical protein